MTVVSRKTRFLNNAGVITVLLLFCVGQATSSFLAIHLLPNKFYQLHQLLFSIVFLLFGVSYARVFATNPGGADDWHLLRIPDTPDIEQRECEHCRVEKPERMHHCRVCRVCVLRYDHHCPWVGNCIGLLNLRYFLQLLVYGLLTAAYSALLQLDFVLRVMEARAVRGKNPPVLIELFAFYIAAIGVIIGFAIAAVLLRLLYDQVSYAARDITTLEKVKKHAGYNVPVYDRGSSIRNLRALLGPVVFWFLPLHVQLP